MKKGFTLLEVLISITIFMIILVFLYKVLDDIKVLDKKFEQHLYTNETINSIYKIIAEDIAESKGAISLSLDRDNNAIVIFQSNNSFHNPFYSNLTYMISSNNNLVRIESQEKFTKEKSGIGFYNNSFIDILLKDVKKFTLLQKEDKFVFIIEPKEKEKIIFTTFKMMED